MSAENAHDLMNTAANEGWQALESQRFADAEAAYDTALKAARQSGDRLAEALFRGYRGQARRGLKKLVEAREDLEHALTLANSEGSLQLVGYFQFLLAELDYDSGDESKAIDRLKMSLDAALACEDGMTAELAFGKLGVIYLDNGWLEPAHECFLRALEQQPEGANQAAWLGNIGQTLAEMGQLEDSIVYYHRAFETARLSGDEAAQAKCLANEGVSHFQQQRWEDALTCYREALALAQKNEDLASRSNWLGNLGNVYLRIGQPDKASELAQQGLALAQELKDKRIEAAHLDTLGDCFLQQGDFEKALAHYSNALTIGQSIKDKIGERVYLSNVARACKRLGQTEKSLQHFRQAIEMFDEQRSLINADAWKTSFAATGQNLYRDTIQACLEAGRRVEALEYVGRAKSRAILDLLRNSPIEISELESTDDRSIQELVARERELSRQIARLERIYSQGGGTTSGDSDSNPHRGGQITADDAPRLYSEWRDVRDQLKRRHRNYVNMVAVDSLNFEELRALWSGSNALLSADTAIMEFFLTDEFMFGAALWNGCTEPAVNLTTDSKQLAGLLNDVADYLEMSSTEGWEVPVSLCKRLYNRLLAPMTAALPASVDRLIIVPHGVLHRLPFAAFHSGEGFLIEKFSLSYLPTASLIPVLASTPQAAPADKQLPYLVSAISDYSATRNDGIVFSSRLRSAAGLEDLSYTLEEAQTVHKLAVNHAGESKLLTNEEVKEGLLSMFSTYPVVHFAGHAVFNPDEPLASGLVLADGSILTAARILQDNALRTKCGKLLVLSACQTGVNVVTNGGEILGLARALMYAGMPNLILSLWEVADRSTSDLMTNFHNAWQAGKKSIAQALAEAQRKAVKENQPIHAWAPFIHLGVD